MRATRTSVSTIVALLLAAITATLAYGTPVMADHVELIHDPDPVCYRSGCTDIGETGIIVHPSQLLTPATIGDVDTPVIGGIHTLQGDWDNDGDRDPGVGPSINGVYENPCSFWLLLDQSCKIDQTFDLHEIEPGDGGLLTVCVYWADIEVVVSGAGGSASLGLWFEQTTGSSCPSA